MKGWLIVIPASLEPVTRKELTGPPDFLLLKAGIGGGYLEVAPHFTHFEGESCVAFCDEDGKGKNLPVNMRANLLWYEQAPWMMNIDVLVGDIAIVVGDRELLAGL